MECNICKLETNKLYIICSTCNLSKICKQFINSFDDKITKVKPINQMLEHCKSV